MAAVANCPHCKYELDIPEGAEANQWLTCSWCRASVLVSDALRNDVQGAATVDELAAPLDDKTIGPTTLPAELSLELGSESLFREKKPGVGDDLGPMPAAPTLEDMPALQQQPNEVNAGTADGPESDKKDSPVDVETTKDIAKTSLGTGPGDEPRLTESGEIAAKRIDKWFRSADTVQDIRPIVPGAAATDQDGPSDFGWPTADSSSDEPTRRSSLTGPPVDVEAASDTANPPPADDQSSDDKASTVPEWSTPFSDEAPPAQVHLADDFIRAPAEEPSRQPTAHELGATIEFPPESLDDMSPGADFEIEEAEVDRDRPTWDDPEQMERLLADVDAAPESDEQEAAAAGLNETESDTAPDDETVPPIVATPHRKRRRQSVPMLLAGCILGGIGGIAIGCYALLWIWGKDGDFFDVARFIPSALLPSEFQTAPSQLAADPPDSQQATADDSGNSLPAENAGSLADSAEVTASYEAPITPPEGPSESDDRYATTASAPEELATELLEFENDVAASLDDAAPVVANAPSYTTEQFAAGLETAREAQAGLMNGDLSDRAVQRTKGLSYTKLSYLAELATFADATSQPQETQELQSTAEGLFRETLSNPQTRGEVAYIATKWIDSPHRSIGGVFTAGNIASQRSAGPVVEFQVDNGVGSPLTVVAPPALVERLNAAGRPVGIVGSILDDPATRISGYTGTAPRIIWAGMLIPLE